MYEAEYSLRILSIVGIWKPVGYSIFFQVALYKIFSIFAICLLSCFNISLGTYFILHSSNDIDEFAESFCWFLASLMGYFKMINFVLRRNDIIHLLQSLREDYLQPRDSSEQIIQDNYDFISRSVICNTNYNVEKNLPISRAEILPWALRGHCQFT